MEEAAQTFADSLADPLHRMIDDELKNSTAFSLIWMMGMLLFAWILSLFLRGD